jgi:hypothetical protein
MSENSEQWWHTVAIYPYAEEYKDRVMNTAVHNALSIIDCELPDMYYRLVDNPSHGVYELKLSAEIALAVTAEMASLLIDRLNEED